MQGALVTGDDATEVRTELRARRQTADVMLTERFTRARQTGDLPETVDPQVAARYVIALSQGIAVEASSGASRADLHRLVDLALLRLPWE